MNKLDLRQVGTIFGHKLYVDVADVVDAKDKDSIIGERDKQEFMVREVLSRAFGMRKKKEYDES